MQKKLIGIAVAAALAPAAAFAQPAGTGVQIYGLFDFSVHFNQFDDATIGSGRDVSKAELHSSASRLGLRGRESLGMGLTGWFQAEAGLAPFRPDPNGPSNGAGFFGGRDTAVGLEGGWGTIMAGTWGTPYKVASLATWNLGTYGIVSHYGMIMNNGDSTGTEPSPNCANAGSTICGNGVMAGRWRHAIRPPSPLELRPVLDPDHRRFPGQDRDAAQRPQEPRWRCDDTDPTLYALSAQLGRAVPSPLVPRTSFMMSSVRPVRRVPRSPRTPR